MKLLLQFLDLGLDQEQISRLVCHRLDCDYLTVPTQIDTTSLNRQFGFAGLSLENFFYSQPLLWNKNKSCQHVMWIWGQDILTHTSSLDCLKNFSSINPNTVIFSNNFKNAYSPSWIYGHAIALTKLSAVILKSNRSMLKKFELEWDLNQYSIIMWAADRIGLDLYVVDV